MGKEITPKARRVNQNDTIMATIESDVCDDLGIEDGDELKMEIKEVEQCGEMVPVDEVMNG